MNFTGISDYLANNPVTYTQPQGYDEWLFDTGNDPADPASSMAYQGYLKDNEISNSMANMAFMSFVKLQQEILQDMKRL